MKIVIEVVENKRRNSVRFQNKGGDIDMKIDIRIPGKKQDEAEYYIKCKKPSQLPVVLKAVSKYGSWIKFTDRSLHCLNCTLGEDELRKVISSETAFTEKDVFVINPYRMAFTHWLLY